MGFKRDFPKIHDSVDVVRVANEMKLCGMKNLSSTLCLVDKKGQENARKSGHVFLYLNLDLCSLEFLLKMNLDLNSCIF